LSEKSGSYKEAKIGSQVLQKKQIKKALEVLVKLFLGERTWGSQGEVLDSQPSQMVLKRGCICFIGG